MGNFWTFEALPNSAANFLAKIDSDYQRWLVARSLPHSSALYGHFRKIRKELERCQYHDRRDPDAWIKQQNGPRPKNAIRTRGVGPSYPRILSYYSKYNLRRTHFNMSDAERAFSASEYASIISNQSYENGVTPKDLLNSSYDFGFTYNMLDENGFIIPYKIDPKRCPKSGYTRIDGIFYDRRNGSISISGEASKSPSTNFITKRDIDEIIRLAKNEPIGDTCYFSLDRATDDVIGKYNPFQDDIFFRFLNRLQVKRFSSRYLSNTEFGKTMYFTDLFMKLIFSFNLLSLTRPWHFSPSYTYNWSGWPSWLLVCNAALGGKIFAPEFKKYILSRDASDSTHCDDHCTGEILKQSLPLSALRGYIERVNSNRISIGRRAIRIANFHYSVVESGDIIFYKNGGSTPFTESSLKDVSEKNPAELAKTDNDPRNHAGLQSFFHSYYYNDLAKAMPAYGRIWRLLEFYNLAKSMVRSEAIQVANPEQQYLRPHIRDFSVREFFATGYTVGGVTSAPQAIPGLSSQPQIRKDRELAGKLNWIPGPSSLLLGWRHLALKNFRQRISVHDGQDLGTQQNDELSFATLREQGVLTRLQTSSSPPTAQKEAAPDVPRSENNGFRAPPSYAGDGGYGGGDGGGQNAGGNGPGGNDERPMLPEFGFADVEKQAVDIYGSELKAIWDVASRSGAFDERLNYLGYDIAQKTMRVEGEGVPAIELEKHFGYFQRNDIKVERDGKLICADFVSMSGPFRGMQIDVMCMPFSALEHAQTSKGIRQFKQSMSEHVAKYDHTIIDVRKNSNSFQNAVSSHGDKLLKNFKGRFTIYK